MKKQGNTSGTTLIKFLLVIFRGIFFWYFVGLILYIVFHIFTFSVDKWPNHTNLPVTFKFSESGDLPVPEGDSAAEFSLLEATGVISTESLPASTMYVSMLVSILVAICVLLIIKLICQILEAAKTGKFLVVENAIRMRHMAFLFLGAFFLGKLKLFVSSYYLADKLDYPGVDFTSLNYYSFAQWEYVFFYLFLLVIAEAFRVGAQLKEENDLTI